MINVKIQTDFASVIETMRERMGERAARALPRIINRAAGSARAKSPTLMRDLYPTVKAATIKARIRFKRATRAVPDATLTYTGKRFRLWGNFNWTPKPTPYGMGISLARIPFVVETGDGRVLSDSDLRHAFVRVTRAGRLNVWIRDTGASYPIKVVVVKGVSVALEKAHLEPKLRAIIAQRFAAVSAQELRFAGV